MNDKEFYLTPIEGDGFTVFDLESGEEVDRPDIAERAKGVFSSAIEKAGGEIVPIPAEDIPDNIAELFPDQDSGQE